MASPTSLRICCRCPRLLFFHEIKSMNSFGFEGSEAEKGGRRGKEADDIFKGIQKDLSEEGAKEIQAEMMQALLGSLDEQKNKFHSIILKNHFIPYYNYDPAHRNIILKNLDLLEDYLIKIVNNEIKKSNNRSASHISKIFRNPKKMERDYICSNGKKITVNGTPDGLFVDLSKGEFVIWELKAMKKVDKEQLLTQVAVYAWLLKGNAPSRAVAFVFDSDEKIIRYSSEEVAERVKNLPYLFKRHQRVDEAINDAIKSIPQTDREGICSTCKMREKCYLPENKPSATIWDISDRNYA